MPFLKSSTSCTVLTFKEFFDLDDAIFPGFSEMPDGARHTWGWLDFVPGDSNTFSGIPGSKINTIGYARRLRYDERKIDKIQLKEEIARLERAYLEPGTEMTLFGEEPAPAKKLTTEIRREIAIQAEEWLFEHKSFIRTKIFEVVFYRGLIYVDSASKTDVTWVINILGKSGIHAERVTAWTMKYDEILKAKTPTRLHWFTAQGHAVSYVGCLFVAYLIEQEAARQEGEERDPNQVIFVERLSNSIPMVSPKGKITTSGESAVNLAEDFCEEEKWVPMALTLMTLNGWRFRLDGSTWAIRGIPKFSVYDHWHEGLEFRIEKIIALYSRLQIMFDEFYERLMEEIRDGKTGIGIVPTTHRPKRKKARDSENLSGLMSGNSKTCLVKSS